MTCAGHQTEAQKLPYMAWHHRAHEAHRRGQRQTQCSECKRWFFSWELRR